MEVYYGTRYSSMYMGSTYRSLAASTEARDYYGAQTEKQQQQFTKVVIYW